MVSFLHLIHFITFLTGKVIHYLKNEQAKREKCANFAEETEDVCSEVLTEQKQGGKNHDHIGISI